MRKEVAHRRGSIAAYMKHEISTCALCWYFIKKHEALLLNLIRVNHSVTSLPKVSALPKRGIIYRSWYFWQKSFNNKGTHRQKVHREMWYNHRNLCQRFARSRCVRRYIIQTVATNLAVFCKKRIIRMQKASEILP